jgi:hypothetical protein
MSIRTTALRAGAVAAIVVGALWLDLRTRSARQSSDTTALQYDLAPAAPAPTAAQDINNAVIPDTLSPPHAGYFFVDSDTRSLRPEELKHLSLPQLRVARNEIFARYGRIFKSEDLRTYFARRSWYVPRTPDGTLSRLEIANVETIQAEERRR